METFFSVLGNNSMLKNICISYIIVNFCNANGLFTNKKQCYHDVYKFTITYSLQTNNTGVQDIWTPRQLKVIMCYYNNT